MSDLYASKPRIFIGLREVAGVYRSLKKGFDELQIENVFVCLGHDKFDYEIEHNPEWATQINSLFRRVSILFQGNWLARILWIGVFQNFFGIFLFFRVFWKYDVFIFGSVSTFFFFLELPLLRLMGKKIIHVFNGSDSRPVYINGFVIQDQRKKTIWLGILLTRIQKFIVEMVEKHSTFIVNIPPQSHFHTCPIANAYIIGYPFGPSAEQVQALSRFQAYPRSSSVRILHAPSKPGPKGTFEFRKAIQSLKDKGYSIEWVEVIGRPNQEVIQEIQKCDFVVDQLYSDMPLAVFAIEAAFFSKPAVVGGYYTTHISRVLRADQMPPSLYCLPEDIEISIEKMIVDVEFRKSLGEKAAQFIQTQWSPKRVAERYLKLIDGSAPQEWFFDPYQIEYLEGCGHSKEQGKKTLEAFLRLGGERSLCIEDKPHLKRLFLNWAAEENS